MKIRSLHITIILEQSHFLDLSCAEIPALSTQTAVKQADQACVPRVQGNWHKARLDSIDIAFLKRNEVYVTPATTSDCRTGGDIHSSVVITGETSTTVTTGTTVGDSVSLKQPDSKVTVVNSGDSDTPQNGIKKARPPVRPFLPEAPGYTEGLGVFDLEDDPGRQPLSWDDIWNLP